MQCYSCDYLGDTPKPHGPQYSVVPFPSKQRPPSRPVCAAGRRWQCLWLCPRKATGSVRSCGEWPSMTGTLPVLNWYCTDTLCSEQWKWSRQIGQETLISIFSGVSKWDFQRFNREGRKGLCLLKAGEAMFILEYEYYRKSFELFGEVFQIFITEKTTLNIYSYCLLICCCIASISLCKNKLVGILTQFHHSLPLPWK